MTPLSQSQFNALLSEISARAERISRPMDLSAGPVIHLTRYGETLVETPEQLADRANWDGCYSPSYWFRPVAVAASEIAA